ncbi:MAG: hypothetical protein D3904_03020 [Candidatus Electrothrix sp. EH2]|nr:hypothetical protein [Candidatus Electrothrix sp. EH2]
MNLKIAFFAALLLAIPSLGSATKLYTIQCEVRSETVCTVKSEKNVRSVRVEIAPEKSNSSPYLVSRDFRHCPPEAAVSLNTVSPSGAKFFVETCDGSNSIETI